MTFWSGSPTTMGRRFVAVLVWTLSAGQEPEEIDCEDDFCFGCQMLNYCNGHGRCSAGGAQSDAARRRSPEAEPGCAGSLAPLRRVLASG